jgi:hypothetical protein
MISIPPINICYILTHFPVLIVVFLAKNRNKSNYTVNLEIIVITILFFACFLNLLFKVLYNPTFNSLSNFFGPQLRFSSFAFVIRTMYGISAQNVSVFGSLQTPFFLFLFWSSRIPHLVLSILHHCFKKPSLTGVTSFKAYVSGRRFEKVRNGHRFENWTSIRDWTSI